MATMNRFDARCALDILMNASGACRDIDAKQFLHGAIIHVKAVSNYDIDPLDWGYVRPPYVQFAMHRTSNSLNVRWNPEVEQP